MQYEAAKPALLLIDADPSAAYRAESAAQLIADASSFMPGLAGCANVTAHSTSSWISTENGTPVTEGGGFHVYVAVADPAPLMEPGALEAIA